MFLKFPIFPILPIYPIYPIYPINRPRVKYTIPSFIIPQQAPLKPQKKRKLCVSSSILFGD